MVTRVIVAVVLASLAAVAIGALFGGEASATNLGSIGTGGWSGIFESAGLLFFAFAGYARIATLGEEVIDPARTIPRAIAFAFGVTLVVYAVVMAAALLAVGPAALAASPAPLATAVQAGSLDWLAPAVRVGGATCLARRVALAHGRREPHHVRDGRQRRLAPLARQRPR